MNSMGGQTIVKSQRSPEVLVPFLGLVYIAFVLLYVVVGTSFAPFSLVFIPFIVLFLLGAFGVWRRSRIGYAAASVLSAIFLILEGTQVVGALSAVTILDEFLSAITAVPILVAVLFYSVLGLSRVWGKAGHPTPTRLIPASSFVILLILGFILGGIMVGVVAADTERRLLSVAGGGDVVIVQGAGNQNNVQFYSPPSFTVKVGTTVTWVNHDGTSHTVTSKVSNLFDSGPFPIGGTFSYKFTQAGTYEYYCTIHPWMTGTIVVTTG
jgi:plastocyanin